jgi:uncharacterized surface protein with fasciclin (FAS1) repeats
MTLRRSAATGATVAALIVAGSALTPTASGAAPAQAQRGTQSLAAVLTAGGVGFDHNWHDFDIVTAAVLAVLKAKPSSPVAALADGKTKLTAFVPTDDAFRRLIHSVTGKDLRSEKKVFKAVAGLGIDTVEAVLEYHVVPGAKINAKTALKANGAKLPTVLGEKIGVRMTKAPQIRLRDKDHNARNPRVVLSSTDINKGNRQIAHGIDRVLRPMDLPKA